MLKPGVDPRLRQYRITLLVYRFVLEKKNNGPRKINEFELSGRFELG